MYLIEKLKKLMTSSGGIDSDNYYDDYGDDDNKGSN